MCPKKVHCALMWRGKKYKTYKNLIKSEKKKIPRCKHTRCLPNKHKIFFNNVKIYISIIANLFVYLSIIFGI